jgi:glucose/arabinose dehydrogenase
MFAYLSRRGTRPRTATRLRRITAALATVTGGLLAWAAAVPAASAATSLIPDPGGASGTVPATAPAVPVQVIAAGGMPGWQITLIAVAAALVAATAAVILDRARASRRAISATG